MLNFSLRSNGIMTFIIVAGYFGIRIKLSKLNEDWETSSVHEINTVSHNKEIMVRTVVFTIVVVLAIMAGVVPTIGIGDNNIYSLTVVKLLVRDLSHVSIGLILVPSFVYMKNPHMRSYVRDLYKLSH